MAGIIAVHRACASALLLEETVVPVPKCLYVWRVMAIYYDCSTTPCDWDSNFCVEVDPAIHRQAIGWWGGTEERDM